MRRFYRYFPALVAILMLALCGSPASVQAGKHYIFNDLGTLGGSQSGAYAINNKGQVVGWAQTAGNATHAFLYPYPGGPMQDLGILGGDSWANGINDSGQVVGGSWVGGQIHPFVYQYPSGPMQDLGTFGSGYWNNQAYAINNSGLVVGTSGVPGAWCHAFSYQYPGGPMQDLNNLANIGPTREGYAVAVNNSGQAVGWYFGTWGEQYHAFLDQCPNGPWKDLTILEGTFYDTARGINDLGQVVGHSYIDGYAKYHAFLYPYPGGPMQDLGTLGGTNSVGFGINNTGQVVGWSDTSTGQHAFLYADGRMQDLNDLVDLPPAVFLIDARCINNQGWIVGYTSSNHAFLLTTAEINVSIDIKPGGPDNSINPKSQGKIAVAILSTPDFDAPTKVDLSSLTFGRTGNENSLAFVTESDVNGDGLNDVVGHFSTQATGFQKGDTKGFLKGKTVDGTPLSGSNSVRIVPGK